MPRETHAQKIARREREFVAELKAAAERREEVRVDHTVPDGDFDAYCLAEYRRDQQS